MTGSWLHRPILREGRFRSCRPACGQEGRCPGREGFQRPGQPGVPAGVHVALRPGSHAGADALVQRASADLRLAGERGVPPGGPQPDQCPGAPGPGDGPHPGAPLPARRRRALLRRSRPRQQDPRRPLRAPGQRPTTWSWSTSPPGPASWRRSGRSWTRTTGRASWIRRDRPASAEQPGARPESVQCPRHRATPTTPAGPRTFVRRSGPPPAPRQGMIESEDQVSGCRARSPHRTDRVDRADRAVPCQATSSQRSRTCASG